MFSFITLFASDLEKTAEVYRAIGLTFVTEKHGDGPLHLAHEKDGFVLEIYKKPDAVCDGMMLGFDVSNITATKAKLQATAALITKDILVVGEYPRMIVTDPEGRQIYIQETKMPAQ